MTHTSRYQALLLMSLASACSALSGVQVKLLSLDFPPLSIVLIRSLCGLLFIGVSIFISPIQNRGSRPGLLLLRGVLGFLALYGFYIGILHISLGDATTLNRTSPIFTALFAFFFLKERLSQRAIFAVVVGFLGVGFISQPGSGEFSFGHLVTIGSGLSAGAAYTLLRTLREVYDSRMIVLSFMGCSAIASFGVLALSQGDCASGVTGLNCLLQRSLALESILLLIGLGATTTLTQIFMTQAYRHSRAGLVAAFSYLSVPLALLAGTILGDDPPGLLASVGITLVILCGVLATTSKSR